MNGLLLILLIFQYNFQIILSASTWSHSEYYVNNIIVVISCDPAFFFFVITNIVHIFYNNYCTHNNFFTLLKIGE